MKHKQIVFLLLIFVTIFVVACSGGTTEEVAATQNTMIDVVAYDIYFGEEPDNAENPPVWTATAGSVATVMFENKGNLEHNWAVVKSGEEVPVPFNMESDMDLILYDTGIVQPGEQMSFPFQVPDEPGEYVVICTVSGHYPVMQGRLIVN